MSPESKDLQLLKNMFFLYAARLSLGKIGQIVGPEKADAALMMWTKLWIAEEEHEYLDQMAEIDPDRFRILSMKIAFYSEERMEAFKSFIEILKESDDIDMSSISTS